MSVRLGTVEEPSSVVSKEFHRLVNALRTSGAINQIPEGRLVPVVIAAGLPGFGKWSYEAAYDSLTAVASWHRPWWRDLLTLVRNPTEI
jgi:hypothetical protein